jgi:hypothetical protein
MWLTGEYSQRSLHEMPLVVQAFDQYLRIRQVQEHYGFNNRLDALRVRAYARYRRRLHSQFE